MPTNYENGSRGDSGYMIAIVILILVIILGTVYYLGGFNNFGFGGSRESNTINVEMPEVPNVNVNMPGENSPTNTNSDI